MSSDKAYLILQLEGPLQAWGFDSQFNRRNTGLYPTKSALAGICCAASGYSRGSGEEREYLAGFRSLEMPTLAIPHVLKDKTLRLRRLNDYHTVQGTMKASGSMNSNAVLTHRQYLMDASFRVMLSGNSTLLQKTAKALEDPVWGVWLGRKNCIPAAPLLVQLQTTEKAALELLACGQPIESYARQLEADEFSAGRDTINDNPVCFDPGKRAFIPRRIAVHEAKGTE